MNQSPAETALSRALIRWSLSRASLIAETPRAWVYRVEQNGREPAVLRQLKPDAGEEEQRGSALLAWYAGEGAATVFDAADGILFMEWLDGQTLGDLARNGSDEAATAEIAGLVRRLHQPRRDDFPALQPLRQRFEALHALPTASWPAMSRDLLARARGIAHQLFDRPAREVPLHGDLHHDNIMSSRRGWLAIDPKGLIGDPAYEVANAFRNPFGASKVFANPRRVAHMAEIFAAQLGLQKKRILAFAAAHAALSICWGIEGRNAEEVTETLSVLPLLLAAYDAA